MNAAPGRKRELLILVGAVLASAAVVLLIGNAAHYATLLKLLRGAAPGWLVVCGIGQTAAFAGYIAAYQAMAELANGPRLPTAIVLRVVGLSLGAFTVASAIGGLSVDFWALREAGEPAVLAGARVIALETMRWAILGVATCVAAIAVLTGLSHGPSWPVPVAWLVVVPACYGGGVWFSSPRRRARFTGDQPGRIRPLLAVAVTALVYIRELRRAAPGLRRRALVGAALFWAGELLCAWAALRSFGWRAQLAPLLLGYTTGYVAETLPLPLGGSGGVEAAMTGGFVLAGAPLSTALLGAVTFRVFNFWVPAIAALLSLVTVRGLRDRLHEIAARRSAPGPSAVG